MFDPIREFTHGDAFQRTDSLLTELMGVVSQEPDFDGKLPAPPGGLRDQAGRSAGLPDRAAISAC